MNCALIMAGGKGTRFWPKSTEKKPKQFINLIGDKTMLQLTIDRIRPIIPIEQIFICTSEQYKEIVIEQIPDINEKNIILEPMGMNTAPCILLSSIYINQIYKDASIVVLPSDHIINNEDKFINVLNHALNFIQINKQGIVTVGVIPNRPETGYGYIKVSEKKENEILKVEKFVEKPDLNKALEYLSSGNYLWNAGIFVFKTDYMLQEYKNKLLKMYELLMKLPNIEDIKYYKQLVENYKLCEKISFDYAIMEKSNEAYVIPSEFGWDDIGTWSSIERYISEDQDSNIIKGNVTMQNSKNCIVYGNDKKIILSDIEDIYFIESDDVIIIGKKDKINDVHEYVKIK